MKLSVIIAAYDMQREIPRTLLSALPPLQQGVEPDDYEIIIVDNGSPQPLILPHLPDVETPIRLVRIPPGVAKPSPVFCINQAVGEYARGDAVLICIDGARMFSPHLIRRTLQVLARLPNAVTYVQSRHVGSKIQHEAVMDGYNQDVEDALLASVNWEQDLDALFAISVMAGAHPKSQPLFQNESNAVGMSRDIWTALGGYNEKFERPGGGLCNLELFNRIMARTSGSNVLLLGETTFHQFHGGAATGDSSYFGNSLEEYRTVTGEDYRHPEKAFLIDVATDYERLKLVWDIF